MVIQISIFHYVVCLSNWYKAIGKVPWSDILPMGFGGIRDANADGKAFVGDSIIGLAVADILFREKFENPLRNQYMSDAVSNYNMANCLQNLFPADLGFQLPPMEEREVQEHNCGTLVEAAVFSVRDDNLAISECAHYLLSSAGCPLPQSAFTADFPFPTGPDAINPKGRLLEMGGRVDVVMVTENPPNFEATATRGDINATAGGRSKKEAERKAAAACLSLLGGLEARQLKELVSLALTSEGELSTSEEGFLWSPIERRPDDQCARLKNGETVEEWFRRAATAGQNGKYPLDA